MKRTNENPTKYTTQIKHFHVEMFQIERKLLFLSLFDIQPYNTIYMMYIIYIYIYSIFKLFLHIVRSVSYAIVLYWFFLVNLFAIKDYGIICRE